MDSDDNNDLFCLYIVKLLYVNKSNLQDTSVICPGHVLISIWRFGSYFSNNVFSDFVMSSGKRQRKRNPTFTTSRVGTLDTARMKMFLSVITLWLYGVYDEV